MRPLPLPVNQKNGAAFSGFVCSVPTIFLGHRTLQSTIWYLDHDLNPLDVSTLEAIKKPHLVWNKERSA